MAEINLAPYARKSIKNPVGVTSRVYRYTVATEPSLNDELNYFAIPKDVKLTGRAGMAADRLDTDATPLLSLSLILSDGTTTKTLVSGWAGAADATAANRIVRNQEPTSWGFVTDSHNYRLYVLWAAVADVFAAGVLTAWIDYEVHDIHGGA